MLTSTKICNTTLIIITQVIYCLATAAVLTLLYMHLGGGDPQRAARAPGVEGSYAVSAAWGRGEFFIVSNYVNLSEQLSD